MLHADRSCGRLLTKGAGGRSPSRARASAGLGGDPTASLQQLDRELELEPRINVVQVDAEQPLDAPEAVAQRVDVQVQRSGCRLQVSVGAEEGGQRAHVLGAGAGVRT